MKRFLSLMAGLSLLLLLCCPVLSAALSARQVYSKVKGSVYTIYSLDYNAPYVIARGSAVAISEQLLVTNCHIALSGDYLLVKLPNVKKPKPARLYYKNEKRDLCLIDVPGVNFNPVNIRGSSDVKIGEIVYAVGNPKGTEKTLSKGIISNRHKVKGGLWLQTDAAIYFGSSGGGLFDENGNLIGITTKMGGNFGFAMPTEWIIEVASLPRQKGLDKPMKQMKTASRGRHYSINPAAIKGLSLLGTYGKDKIALYRNNNECFLLMRGEDTNGRFRSIAIWNPKFSKIIVVFPTTKEIKKAISIVHQAMVNKRTEKQTNYRSDSKLYLGSHFYNLYGERAKEKIYPFLIARIRNNTNSLLLSLNSFKATYNSLHPQIGHSTVIYPLHGVEEALSAYKVKCK